MEDFVQIRMDIQSLKLQLLRLESNAESEKGTLSRITDGLRKEISLIEDKYFSILFDRENGFLIELDRLIQSEKNRKKWQFFAICQSIVLLSEILFNIIVRK